MCCLLSASEVQDINSRPTRRLHSSLRSFPSVRLDVTSDIPAARDVRRYNSLFKHNKGNRAGSCCARFSHSILSFRTSSPLSTRARGHKSETATVEELLSSDDKRSLCDPKCCSASQGPKLSQPSRNPRRQRHIRQNDGIRGPVPFHSFRFSSFATKLKSNDWLRLPREAGGAQERPQDLEARPPVSLFRPTISIQLPEDCLLFEVTLHSEQTNNLIVGRVFVLESTMQMFPQKQ